VLKSPPARSIPSGGEPAERSDAPFVHFCAFCSWHRPAQSLTVLSPRCEHCGCTLGSCPADRFDPDSLGQPQHVSERRVDASIGFVALAAGPFLLPVVGVKLGDLVFAVPLGILVFAGIHCLGTARRSAQRRSVWVWLAGACALAGAASLVAVLSSILGQQLLGAYYIGALASVALLGGIGALALGCCRGLPLERGLDGLLAGVLLLSVGIYFVLGPALDGGDVLLGATVLVDLLALTGALVALAARPARRHRRVALALAGCAAAAAAGDFLASANASGQIPAQGWITALLWALAAYLIALASEFERTPAAEPEAPDAIDGGARRWVLVRIVLPMITVLAFPGILVGLWLDRALTTTAELYFGGLGVAVLAATFGRQAFMLVEHRRAALRERRLRAEAVRRNDDLEALTGLATTMTQSLEEAPILERGLGVVHLAARAVSSALHTVEDGSRTLRAAAGDWRAERPWTTVGCSPVRFGAERRGRRAIVRLPLAARGHDIGLVTLVRDESEEFTEAELGLLRLLVDQLAIAVQNARDYLEKLDQAIRDPLTGLYNRRFFSESLDKELHRTERYGSQISIALFDIDDFKAINDTYGHSAGDDVLRRIGTLVSALLRPTDSFARLGGEEFGLLLPETSQLDALLVAERIRTAIARSTILHGRPVTISGGVSSCPTDATVQDDLVDRADAALYWAKRNGKNLCSIAGEVVIDPDEPAGDTMISHLHALVSTIDARQLQTKDHSENVAAYAVAIGQAMGLDGERIVRLRRAGFLHDIGKVAVSRRILEKPASLTAEEWTEMKIHPVAGATMLLHSGLGDEALWVRHHHERIDGGGYPDRLSGAQIPLESRILFVADSFEAMTSDRPYKRGISVGDAVQELRRCAGSQFDPPVVDTLVGLVDSDQLTILALHQ